jgi:hypothetical protein
MSLVKIIRRWMRLPGRFSAKDFRKREKLRPDYALLAGCLLTRLEFETVFDVGCANGFLLAEFANAGKRFGGIEVSRAVREVLPPALGRHVSVGDFAEAGGEWDLVCCVEIAEHIPPGRSVDLVETLVGMAQRWIYFTAAPPGQKGHGHINCRPHEEWIGWFEQLGWRRDEERTQQVRSDLEALSIAHWLRTNSLVFRPGD